MTPTGIERAVVLGLDGATLDLLGPWMDQGLLPSLRALRETGAHGRLRSMTPAVTAAAWASAITGKNPGKHGIYGFRERHNRLNQVPRISSYSVRVARLWNILNEGGISTGVANLPIMYPAEPMNGFSIAGHMASTDDLEYTYPSSLREELRQLTGADILTRPRASSSVGSVDGAVEFLDQVCESIGRHRSALFHVWDRFDPGLLWYVFDVPGVVQRFFWNHLAPSGGDSRDESGDPIRCRALACFRALDAVIGEVWERCGERTDLYVVSPSGYGPLEGWINLNVWLMEQGLLRLCSGASRSRTLARAARVVWEGPAMPRRARGAIRERLEGRRRALAPAIDEAVDWGRSRAYCASLPGQGIYLCGSDGDEYQRLRRQIRDALLSLTVPGEGVPLFDWVRFKEEVFRGDALDAAPDIVFATHRQKYAVHPRLDVAAIFTTTEQSPGGFHRAEGALFAVGPDIRVGQERATTPVEDVAPTILHRFGLPVPADFDGQVMTDLFDVHWTISHPVRSQPAGVGGDEGWRKIYTEDDEATVAERLRSLGYIE